MGKAKTAIIIVVLAALIGGYYFYLSNKTETPKETKVSAVQDVILRDLDKNYPPTPKEVVKYYSELSKCLYNENIPQRNLNRWQTRCWLSMMMSFWKPIPGISI